MLIETASSTDFQAIRDLQATVAGSGLDEDTFREAAASGDCIVARIDGAVAGFALVGRWFFGRRFLSLLAVRADMRRRGLATQLVGRVLANSPNGLHASTNASNVASQRFFERLGFERSGIVENLDEDDPELVYYKKP